MRIVAKARHVPPWLKIAVPMILCCVSGLGPVLLVNRGSKLSTASAEAERVVGYVRSRSASVPAASLVSSQVQFDRSDRYAGLSFTSTEGQVPPTNGLRVLDWGSCALLHPGPAPDELICGPPDRWLWLLADNQGWVLWVATHAGVPNVGFTVLWSIDVSPPPTGESLHFSEHDPTVLALVRGSSDSTFHWTDIVGAWTIDTEAGTVTPRSTDGVTVFDLCASRPMKFPVSCLAPNFTG